VCERDGVLQQVAHHVDVELGGGAVGFVGFGRFRVAEWAR
jgi:hypothetical protein